MLPFPRDERPPYIYHQFAAEMIGPESMARDIN